ncbi:phage tail protein [Rhizobium sp. YS-1r]|uniref:phage tail protein n=1 Tax=Rhizobium sp. YS-1r TaxID=1532558 RepID=UPI001AEC031A|nr:phage tail protein [Rhizobium sp. YS-1r]
MTRERQAALASIDAIKSRNVALADTPAQRSGTRAFNTSNLAAQGFDIAATAPFMPWYTVALQQGPQVSQVFNDIRASGEKIGPAVAGAFMQLANPISLVTIGTIGAAAAAVSYFSGILSDSADASAKLDEQARIIGSIADRWGDAVPALREYADQVTRAQNVADARQGLTLINEKALEEVKRQLVDARISISALVQDLRAAGEEDEVIKRLQSTFGQFAKSANEGKLKTEEVKSVQDALAVSINSTGIPALKDFATFFDTLSSSALLASENVQKASDAVSRMQDVTTWRSYNPSTGKLETNAQPWDENIQNPGFTTPELGPVPGRRPLRELEADPSQKKTETAARSAANAYRDLIKSADDRIGQMKLEAQLSGQTGVAADTLRFKLDLLQQSEDKGRSLTPKQVEAINARVEAFKKYAEEAAKAQLASDLLFEREQLGRSAMDQQIAAQLKGAGLPVDFDSYEAGLIRANLQLQYARDLTGDFASTLTSSLQQGKDFWDALGDAGVSALKRISDTLVNDLLNSLFQVNSAAAGGSSGGGLLGLITGGIGSLFGGSSSSSASSSAWSLGLDDWQFARGGYTGPGGIHEPRGVVHAGEVVWSQRDVARAGGVATVEAMRLGRRGYADGGVVDVAPLMSSRMAERQSAAAADRGMGTLKLLLGLSADENGNILPAIRKAIADNVPEYVQLAFDDYDQALPDRVAAIQSEPWRR